MKRLLFLLLLFSSLTFTVGCNKKTNTKSEIKTTVIEPRKDKTVTSTVDPSLYSLKLGEFTSFKNLEYGTYNEAKYDLYLNKNYKDETNVKLILFIHGGAWVAGSKDDYQSFTEIFSKYAIGEFDNVAIASINYRLTGFESNSNTVYDMIDDITLAIKGIKKYLNGINLTVDSLTIGGHSAGGHLALLYAYKYKEESEIPLSMVFSLSGPTDINLEAYSEVIANLSKSFPELQSEEGINTFVKNATGISDTALAYKELEAISPINSVDSNTIPTIICHGDNDAIVPYKNTTDLIDKLTTFNVENKLITIPNGTHSDTMTYARLKTYKFLEEFYYFYNEHSLNKGE